MMCLNTCVVYGLGLGLCGLTPLPTIFPLYCGGLLYWRKKLEYSEKTADLPLVTDKLLSHNVVSSTPRLNGFLLD